MRDTTPSLAPLAGKQALVTGASGGIGKALAIAFGQAGADVVVHHYDDPKGAQATVDAITALGRRSLVVTGDIREVQQIERFMAETDERIGGLDILVNNAGITGWNAALEVSEALWDRVVDTNLKGTFFCSLAAARRMRTRGGGVILNISSVLSYAAMPNLTVYAASKAGINALTRQLAMELGPHKIRVNAIAPGPIVVERTLADDPDYAENWGRVAPLGRVGYPEDLAPLAIFLCSPAAAWTTGQVITVDGGVTLPARIPEESMNRGLLRNR